VNKIKIRISAVRIKKSLFFLFPPTGVQYQHPTANTQKSDDRFKSESMSSFDSWTVWIRGACAAKKILFTYI